MEAIAAILDRISEFVARDGIYILSGALICFSIDTALFDMMLAQGLSQSKFSFLVLAMLAPAFHVLAYVNRTLIELLGVYAIEVLDPRLLAIAKPLTVWKAIASDHRDKFYVVDGVGANYGFEQHISQDYEILRSSSQFPNISTMLPKMKKRAVFLKEILATTGSAILIAGSIIFISSLCRRFLQSGYEVRYSLVGLGLILVGVLACRLALYQSYRQGSLIIAMENELRLRSKKE